MDEPGVPLIRKDMIMDKLEAATHKAHMIDQPMYAIRRAIDTWFQNETSLEDTLGRIQECIEWARAEANE